MNEDMGEREYHEVRAEYVQVHRRFQAAMVAAISLLCGGAVFYHIVEHFGWVDAFYFCTITLTTIGYGDLVPKTDAGKLFTIAYVLIGIGIIAYFAQLLVRQSVVKRELHHFGKRKS